MLRAILAVFLMVVTAQAQVQTSVPTPDEFRLRQIVEQQPIVVDPEYRELRRGTEEGICVKAKTDPSLASAGVYRGAPAPHNGRFVATQLEIEGAPGITSRSIRYVRRSKVELKPGKPEMVMGPYTAEFRFKLRASHDLSLGDHVVKGKLKFQRITQAGVSEPEELEFEIPVRVVERHAPLRKNTYYPWEMKPADWVRVILLMPIMLPVTLLTWDGC